MFIETAVAVGLFCAPTKRKHVNEFKPYVVNGASSIISFHVASGKTMERLVSEEFDELAGVGAVGVIKNGRSLSVDVEMSAFDKTSRRNVYATERRIAKSYPGYAFDVRLIDCSRQHTNDAFEG